MAQTYVEIKGWNNRNRPRSKVTSWKKKQTRNTHTQTTDRLH